MYHVIIHNNKLYLLTTLGIVCCSVYMTVFIFQFTLTMNNYHIGIHMIVANIYIGSSFCYGVGYETAATGQFNDSV